MMMMVMLDRRYASLPNIMKAKKKPMEKKKLSDYNIEFKRRLEVVGVTGISTTNTTQPPFPQHSYSPVQALTTRVMVW